MRTIVAYGIIFLFFALFVIPIAAEREAKRMDAVKISNCDRGYTCKQQKGEIMLK